MLVLVQIELQMCKLTTLRKNKILPPPLLPRIRTLHIRLDAVKARARADVERRAVFAAKAHVRGAFGHGDVADLLAGLGVHHGHATRTPAADAHVQIAVVVERHTVRTKTAHEFFIRQ